MVVVLVVVVVVVVKKCDVVGFALTTRLRNLIEGLARRVVVVLVVVVVVVVGNRLMSD